MSSTSLPSRAAALGLACAYTRGGQLVWMGAFIPHIEVVHQSFCQAGRCRDGLSPPLLCGEEGEGIGVATRFLRGAA